MHRTLLALTLSWAVACGASTTSEEPSSEDSITASDTDVPTDTPTDSDPPAETDTPTETDTPAETDTPTDSGSLPVCLNEADAAVLAEDQGQIATAATTCVLSCAFEADLGACVSACLLSSSGLTEACNDCFGERYGCVLTQCSLECVSDVRASACVSCSASNCDPAFAACSGLDPATTPL
jgi:hypothetical protein